MPRRNPIFALPEPDIAAAGSQADRIAAFIAAMGLVGASLATLWFFAGFYETDPDFSPASSAFLLALGLGAFAIIPCAIIMRLGWTAWRSGFRIHHGVWTLFLMMPWIAFGVIGLKSDWLPFWLSGGALLVAGPLCAWALLSFLMELRRRRRR